ncbi:hypothetical protein HN51_009177 [Arachis hypogaea]|uniref:Pentacotripeptide-repeat region of PRORP domain-containing protein n=1 Tax=Arachis hypogaea TaxID=3818 RepID=A0A445D0C4_ARAHY|nr:pentatricopeptide repeat-containing protein At3g02650, mitochondrial [Arachis hypogaea]QHO43653.1 Pentatricopeptide repeat-containing protein [Arachis hypogaea]RYR56659.1 hypothetical protein Ahy_A05g022337 [Arachis hypogaea]
MSSWRLILARNAAARNCIIASRIPNFPLSQSCIPSQPPLKPQPTPPSSTASPRSVSRFFLPNDFRFFSPKTDITFDDDPPQNDAVPLWNETEPQEAALEEGEGQLEIEEEIHEINDERLESLRVLLQSNDDRSFESSLNDMCLALDHNSVARIIEIPSVSGENLVRFFNWARNDKSFKVSPSVLETVVSKVCQGMKKKEIYSLWDLVRHIGEEEKGVLNVGILNELISSLSKLGKGKAALEVFDKLEDFEIVPNADSYYFTVEALCRRKAFDLAWSVCRKMIDSQMVLEDVEKIGSMVSWFCKGKMAREAHEVYMAMEEKRKQLPLSCISFLVAKLCQENETVGLALKVLADIQGERRHRAIKPFSAVVRALCRIKDLDAAKKLVLEMIADGPPPGNAVFNFVITGYCKVGEMGQAVEMMKLLESRGLKPDLYAYAVLMSGYSNGGEMEESRKILEEAKKKHPKLTPVMYHTLVRGYCKLEQFDKALELLTEMKDFGVRPSADEYEKLIQSLCLKALDWEMAEKLQEEMKENGLHLKGITRALIRAVKEMENEVLEAGNSGSAA